MLVQEEERKESEKERKEEETVGEEGKGVELDEYLRVRTCKGGQGPSLTCCVRLVVVRDLPNQAGGIHQIISFCFLYVFLPAVYFPPSVSSGTSSKYWVNTLESVSKYASKFQL